MEQNAVEGCSFAGCMQAVGMDLVDTAAVVPSKQPYDDVFV